MAKNKVSINDIAASLNISKTTVSFILNGKAREKKISEQLVKKVLEKVDELGYQPNHLAKSLRTGKTNIIGLMVEDISNPFYASIAKEIEAKAYQNNYKIVYCSTENDPKRAREFLTMFSSLGVDGCIIAPTMGIEDDILKLIEQGIEVVIFDRKFQNTSSDVVMVNNQQGLYTAVEHLYDNGYRNIGMIALVLDNPEKEDRIIGYKNAMEKHGLKPRVFPLPFKMDLHGYVEDIQKILKKEKSFDALVFGTNYLCINGLKAIGDLKLKIPEDLAIVSFDDHSLFRIHKPNISVIAQPIEDIAQTIINTLLDKLKNKEKHSVCREITLSTRLIERESSRKIGQD